MDTKLKSRRKLGIFLIIVTILSAAYVMLYNYDVIYEKAVEEAQKTYTTSLSDREYLESFLEFSYILYNQEISSKTGEAKMSQDEINDVADVWMEDYEALYPYLDYRIEDGSGTVLGRSTANTGNGLTDDSFKEYAFGMVLTYDEHGNPDVKVVKSGEKSAQSIVLRKIIDNWSETVEDATHGELKTPKNRTCQICRNKYGTLCICCDWCICHRESDCISKAIIKHILCKTHQLFLCQACINVWEYIINNIIDG